MQGWRKLMEDTQISDINIGPLKDTYIFGVFDGHGGTEVAKFVEHHFTEEFLKNENYSKKDIKKALEENYQKMDELMLEKEGNEELFSEYLKSQKEISKLRENNYYPKKIKLLSHEPVNPKEKKDAIISMFTGSTANVLVIQDKKLYFSNAGDSRSIICKKGQPIAMSIEHKPSISEEAKRIEKTGAWIKDGRIFGNLNISRGLGDLEYKKDKKLKPEEQVLISLPDVKIENLGEDIDFIVLASDGVWECKNNQEICDFFTEKFKKEPNEKISKFIEELFDEIFAPNVYNETGTGCDNMSCIVIKIKKKDEK